MGVALGHGLCRLNVRGSPSGRRQRFLRVRAADGLLELLLGALLEPADVLHGHAVPGVQEAEDLLVKVGQ